VFAAKVVDGAGVFVWLEIATFSTTRNSV